MDLSLKEYRALAEFRYRIRLYLSFSAEQARRHGLEPQQHQLLLTVKGLPEGARSTIGELAVRLQLKHHSTVELVDRLVRRGYVARTAGPDDRREVIVRLTAAGAQVLRNLSLAHREELETAGPAVGAALRSLRKSRLTRSGNRAWRAA